MKKNIVIVTGATGDIGTAITKKMVNKGWYVAALDLNDEKGKQMEKESDRKIRYFHCDITSEKDVKKTVNEITKEDGEVKGLVNGAGIGGKRKRIANMDMKEFDRVMNVNFRGSYIMTKHVIPVLIKNNGGSIVNISSIAGFQSIPCSSVYAASKKALISLTESVTTEYFEENIRCNSVSPGSVNGGVRNNGTYKPTAEEEVRAKRRAQPSEIADVIAYLLSDESSHISGENIVIDKGRRFLRPDLMTEE